MKNFLSGAALTTFPDVRRGRPFPAAPRPPTAPGNGPANLYGAGGRGCTPPDLPFQPCIGARMLPFRAHPRGCCPHPFARPPGDVGGPGQRCPDLSRRSSSRGMGSKGYLPQGGWRRDGGTRQPPAAALQASRTLSPPHQPPCHRRSPRWPGK